MRRPSAEPAGLSCASGSITLERSRLVDFSDPYLETELSLVVRRDSPIQAPGDLIGVQVGVRRATRAEQFVRTHSPAAGVRTFDGHAEPHRALADRLVDAVVDHAPIAAYFARTEVGLRVAAVLEGCRQPGSRGAARGWNVGTLPPTVARGGCRSHGGGAPRILTVTPRGTVRGNLTSDSKVAELRGGPARTLDR